MSYPDDGERLIKWQLDHPEEPYWVAQYTNGKELREYDGVGWADIPKDQLWRVELHCPTGQIPWLEDRRRLGWRLAHFGFAAASGLGHQVFARCILLHHGDGKPGACTIWAWEPGFGVVGPFEDDIHDMQYMAPISRTLSWPVIGLKPD